MRTHNQICLSHQNADKLLIPLGFILFLVGCSGSAKFVRPPIMVQATPASSALIALAGDVYFGGSMPHYLDEHGLESPCESLPPQLRSADLFVANLESPVCIGGVPAKNKKFVFRMHPKSLELLHLCGIDAVNLANNHSMDYGASGLQETIQYLEDSGITFFGAGATRQQARTPWVTTINGIRIAFLGYSLTLPRSYWAGPNKAGSATGDSNDIAKDVKTALEKADHVFVTFHWGGERIQEPRAYQRTLGRAAIDAGAALVYGHHPHIPQEIEIYKGHPILYSLGNFVFASNNPNSQLGLVALAEVTSNRIASLKISGLDVYYPRVGFEPRKMNSQSFRDAMLPLMPGSEAGHEILWDMDSSSFLIKFQ